MINFLFLVFAYFTEALIVSLYAKNIYKPKKSYLSALSFTCALYFLLFIIYRFVFNNEILNLVLIALVNIIILYSLFKSSLKSALFHGIALTILQLVAEFLTAYFTSLALRISFNSSIDNHFESGVILSRILYFLLSSLLSKISAKETNAKSWGKWCALSLLPISSMIVIIVLKLFTDNMKLTTYQNVAIILSISFLLLINIIIYIIYEQAEENNQKLIELELTNQKNEINLQYLDILEKKNDTMNIMAHDYKNHILTISNMSDSPEIKEYINEMIGEISKYNQVAKTKNKLLDVILNKYTDICQSKNILFETSILSENLSFINNHDLSALFNNVLDNAVEAAIKSKNKFINVEIANSLNSYHKVTVINSSDAEPKIRNGNIVTTKENKEAHGFGTKSIKKVVKKYNGEMQWDYDNATRQFKLVILFPDEQ